MALNPNDLLIFSAREEEEPADQKKAKKPEQTAQPQTPTPQSEQEKKPAIEQKIEEPNFVPTNEQQIQQIENAAAPSDIVEAALDVSLGTQKSHEKLIKAKRNRSMNPKRLAEHLSCELHPWRRAYAICDFCKRAFCYEDIVESSGKFYCLDDIDKVPETIRRSQMIRYNNLGLLSSALFMLVFLAFVYFSYQQMITLFQSIASPLTFIKSISLAQVILVLEFVFAVLSLVSAILVLLNSEHSFRISVSSGLLTVGLFIYQYLELETMYLLAIAIIAFVALVTLAYSRVSYETLPDGQMFDSDGTALGITKSSF